MWLFLRVVLFKNLRSALTLRQTHARARACRVVSTCLALLTAGALGISDEARRGQMTFLDDLLDAIRRLPFMHMRAGHPLIALALPPLVNGEYTLPSVAADETGVPTVTVQLQSRLPRAITLDKVALVVDRVDSTNAVREYSDAFECGPIELAPNSTTAVKLTYKVRHATPRARPCALLRQALRPAPPHPAPALTNPPRPNHPALPLCCRCCCAGARHQGDSPNTGHIVAALHCHIGALVLREALVPLGFAQTTANSGQSDLVNAASGLLVGPDGVAADDNADAMLASAGTGTLDGAGSGTGEVLASAFPGGNDVAVGSGGRLTPDAASALWWTWWPADLPVASVSFEDTTSLLGCAHVDLRPLIAALVGEPVRPRAPSLNIGQEVPIPERLRRNGWRLPRRFIRIRRDLQEPGAPVLRVDEPAPLPSTLLAGAGHGGRQGRAECGAGRG